MGQESGCHTTAAAAAAPQRKSLSICYCGMKLVKLAMKTTDMQGFFFTTKLANNQLNRTYIKNCFLNISFFLIFFFKKEFLEL